MTTVGYGDITPRSAEGKIVAIVVMLIGIGTATLLIGAVAQKFVDTSLGRAVRAVEAEEEDVLAQVREITTRLQRLEETLERARSRPA